jgi:hypothetical protein
MKKKWKKINLSRIKNNDKYHENNNDKSNINESRDNNHASDDLWIIYIYYIYLFK